VVGWQWSFLGGYHLSSDLTVSLGLLAWLPVTLFGEAPGFHLLHLALFAAIPVLVFFDLRHEPDRSLKWLATGLAAVFVASYSYRLLGSGDTNSLAGVATTALALLAAEKMRRDSWGGPLLVLALTLITYSHAGFLLFALCYLALHATLVGEWGYTRSLAIAVVFATIAGLPLTYESWVHRAFFTANNALLDPPALDVGKFLRQVYYNVELLMFPGRWLNDYTGLTTVFLPVYVFAAMRSRGRPQFHALAALGTVALTRLYDPAHFGWGFIRAAHMHVFFAAPVLGWFVASQAANRALAGSIIATLAFYVQISFAPVPHIQSLREFDADLVDRIASLDKTLILIENSYHPEMDGDTSVLMEPTPFRAHFEALLPGATGQRFYAGIWDGWQWAPARRNLLSNGSLNGRRIELLSEVEITSELRRWGVRDLFVWSKSSTRRLLRSPAFTNVWQSGLWSHFQLMEPDVRNVTVLSGSGELTGLDPLSAEVRLRSVRAGDRVTVRTNYYPEWRIMYGAQHLPSFPIEGQLAFTAPADGNYTVRLHYPKRQWLLVLAVAALVMGSVITARYRKVDQRS
jgi:hypothetical protein